MFEDFLRWLLTSAGSIAAVSWILERSKWFQSLISETKDYVIFGASALIGISAQLALTYLPADFITTVTPYFAIVASVFGTVFLGKAFHKVDKV